MSCAGSALATGILSPIFFLCKQGDFNFPAEPQGLALLAGWGWPLPHLPVALMVSTEVHVSTGNDLGRAHMGLGEPGRV